ncbi:tyrosine-type recombinase/integrase [Clostridium sp.]|uniref:tyrosine-type recombinase/integrase n=1 Tax=Clostridium sp. TaxID=1506 RepID=UPI003D6D7958
MKKQNENRDGIKGYSPKTIKNYILHVSTFSKFHNKSPELLGEEEIREFLHHCITVRKLSEGTVNYYNACIKFFYAKVLHRKLDLEQLPRAKERRRLPAILSPEEMNDIFNATHNIKYKAIFMTIYSAGLRISEVCNLKVSDIDSKNMQIFIREGKGNKNRYSILGKSNHKILREYWEISRPEEYLFSGRYSTNAISPRSVQVEFGKFIERAKITKHVTVHSVRHAFATHLLNGGTDVCHIQKLLGHTRISSTSVYLHLRRLDLLSIKSPLDTLLGDDND